MNSRKWQLLIEDFEMLACLYAARLLVWRELRRRRREGTLLLLRSEESDEWEVFLTAPAEKRPSATGPIPAGDDPFASSRLY